MDCDTKYSHNVNKQTFATLALPSRPWRLRELINRKARNDFAKYAKKNSVSFVVKKENIN